MKEQHDRLRLIASGKPRRKRPGREILRCHRCDGNTFFETYAGVETDGSKIYKGAATRILVCARCVLVDGTWTTYSAG